MDKRKKRRIVCWETKGPTGPAICVDCVDEFDARGKQRIFGRAERFGRLALHMDVWICKDGRLLARFWSRSDDVDCYSYEITGMPKAQDKSRADVIGEHWIPELLRDEFDDWVLSEIPFIY